MNVIKAKDYEELGRKAANVIAAQIIMKPNCVLGLATGSSPISTYKELMSLAGVGRKTANVVRSVCFDIPSFAVDTHVERDSKRLGLAKPQDDVRKVEEKLKRKLPRERWNKGHHLFIFFGRYLCTSRSPKCGICPFSSICRRQKIEAKNA